MDPLLQRNKIQIWWNKRMKWCYQLQRDNAYFSLTCNSTSKWDWWFDHMQLYCLSHLKPADLNINCKVYFLSSFWLSLLLFNKTVEGSESDNCTLRHHCFSGIGIALETTVKSFPRCHHQNYSSEGTPCKRHRLASNVKNVEAFPFAGFIWLFY